MSPAFDTPHPAVTNRATSESMTHMEMNLDDTGAIEISTGVPFWDYMFTALGKHSLIDLKIQASGDTHVDVHHTVEDTAICLGLGLKEALGDKCGIKCFGGATASLDEALARAVVDVAGRPYIAHEGEPAGQEYHLIGGHFIGPMTRHALESPIFNSGARLHMSVLSGCDPYRIIEAQFKALAWAPRSAVEPDPRIEGIPSTKGALQKLRYDRFNAFVAAP